MKNHLIVKICAGIIIVSTLTLGGYGLYTLGIRQGKQITALTNNRNPIKKILYWHDPMVPEQRFDKPGKSPFMDMQLVPVYAGNEKNTQENSNSVSINPHIQQNLGVRTALVTQADLSPKVVAAGSIAYDERDMTVMQARSNGYAEHVYVRSPSDSVHIGQPLADLYVPDWVAAQEEYLTVKHMPPGGLDNLLDGARQRMRLAGMSDEQIRLIDTSDKLHPRITITAPINGVVTELSVREGMTVTTGTPMFRINGLSTVWINADIPESVSEQVQPGYAAQATTPSLPGIIFHGKISAILPDVNNTTRTLKARIVLNNPQKQLIPGMFTTVSITSHVHKNSMLVPSEAVIRTGTRSIVMLAGENGQFHSTDVTTGIEMNGQTEILSGLKVAQKVVISGQFLVDSEASLKETANRMSDTPSQATGAQQ